MADIMCTSLYIRRKNGKLYNFIRPKKIYLGKNISDNLRFEEGIRNIADKYKIPLGQQSDV